MVFVDEKDGFIYAECEECQRILKLRKNMLIPNGNKYQLQDPIECFCENISDQITGVPQSDKQTVVYATAPVSPRNEYIPHCPTCGSTNVRKISVGSKVVGGAMFGLFSSNVRKSYRCDNCGYKW